MRDVPLTEGLGLIRVGLDFEIWNGPYPEAVWRWGGEVEATCKKVCGRELYELASLVVDDSRSWRAYEPEMNQRFTLAGCMHAQLDFAIHWPDSNRQLEGPSIDLVFVGEAVLAIDLRSAAKKLHEIEWLPVELGAHIET